MISERLRSFARFVRLCLSSDTMVMTLIMMAMIDTLIMAIIITLYTILTLLITATFSNNFIMRR
jgi:hypothetical protein